MLSLRSKLVLSYALLFLITVGVGAYSFSRFQRLSSAVNTVLRDNYDSILAADKMKQYLGHLDAAAALMMSGDVQHARTEFAENSHLFQQQQKIARNNITEPGEKNIVDDIDTKYDRYGGSLDKFLKRSPRDPGLGDTYLRALRPGFVDLEASLDALLKLNNDAMKVADARAKESVRVARLSTLVMVGLSALLAIIFALFFFQFAIQPLTQLIRGVRRIGQGDLDQHIEVRSRDEVGEVAAEFNRMAVRLRELRQSDLGRILVEQKKSDAVINSIYEPVIVTDAEGAILKVNSAAKQLMGNGTQAEGSRVAAAIGGEKIIEAVKAAVAMQRPIADEEEASLLPLRLGDEEKSFRLRTTPMRDGDGRLLGAVTVLEDVTGLREVDRFKNNFITVASRKLREPLQSIRLALYVLLHGNVGPTSNQQREIIEGAEADAQDLWDLMSDLLELAEIESGARELKPEQLRPVEIGRVAIERHRSAADCKQITLENKIYPDLTPVDADRRAMLSILDNLMGNAIEFTDPRGSVTISAEEKDNFVLFSVKDTGHGIPKDKLRRIFSRFMLDRKSKGATGLGLPLVRRLVEAQGGQISVESTVGQGTTFSFSLPVVKRASLRHLVEQ